MTVTVVNSLSQFKKIINGNRVAVFDFWATWCGPCRMISPVFEQLSNEYGNVDFYRVDVDEQPEISKEVDVTGLPTFATFKNGKKIRQMAGANRSGLVELVANPERLPEVRPQEPKPATRDSVEVTTVNSLTQFRKIINGNRVAVFDFWATWCGPCRMISPVFEQLSKQHPHVDFYRVDVDEQSEISKEVDVTGLPTFATFKNGKKIRQMAGADRSGLAELVANPERLPEVRPQAPEPATRDRVEVTTVNSLAQFKKIISGNRVAVFDFWAPWCGPCRFISPIFEQLSKQYPDLDFYKVDVDEQSEISKEVNITSLPTFTTFKNGKKIKQMSGANQSALQQLLADVGTN